MGHHFIAKLDFSKRTLNALERKSIFVIGSFSNDGEVLYTLSDNGTCRVRSYFDVLALAK
jgi:hypothetical protein